MSIIVTIKEAEADLASLCVRARQGEEVIIVGDGEQVRLQPMSGRKPRPLGADADKVFVHDNFDDPLPDDLQEAFGCGS